MKSISVYTMTLGGRDHYLKKLMYAIANNCNGIEIDWTLILQGDITVDLPLHTLPFKTTVIHNKENKGIALTMNQVIPTLKGDIIIKMDDDALPQSSDFFKHILAVHDLMPTLVFSPYPVGLINNPGGVLSNNRRVMYSQTTDTYYTLRFVNHIGGFCRVSPKNVVKDWVLSADLIKGASGNEDSQHSNLCIYNNIPMAYLENSIIVEHQESTLGQHERYKEYFRGRF